MTKMKMPSPQPLSREAGEGLKHPADDGLCIPTCGFWIAEPSPRQCITAIQLSPVGRTLGGLSG